MGLLKGLIQRGIPDLVLNDILQIGGLQGDNFHAIHRMGIIRRVIPDGGFPASEIGNHVDIERIGGEYAVGIPVA